jgi:hypothetical protein
MGQRKASASLISKSSVRAIKNSKKKSLPHAGTVAQLPAPIEPKGQELARPGVGPVQLTPLNERVRAQALERAHPMSLAGVAYIHVSNKMALPQELADAAGPGACAFLEAMPPRDPLEHLALSQLLLTHGRVAWLSKLLTAQAEPQSFAIVSDACEKALGSFVRLMRAFREYREPRNAGPTVSISQANLAQQQVVQNFSRQEVSRNENGDEQSRIHPAEITSAEKILPADASRPEGFTGHGREKQTMGVEHGASNSGRKMPSSHERTPARPTFIRNRCTTKDGRKDS